MTGRRTEEIIHALFCTITFAVTCFFMPIPEKHLTACVAVLAMLRENDK